MRDRVFAFFFYEACPWFFMTKLQPHRTPLILVADDDRSTRIILRLLLLREGYEVIEVENGEQCIAAFSEHRPTMVLLDAQMPVMDGFDCCEQLKKLPFADRVPILMITGLEDSESVNRAFQSGAADFIAKPINALILSRRLRYLLTTSQVEATIRESEERYRLVVENLKEVIFQTDVEGRLTFLNPAWESITGFSQKSFIGKKFFSFLCPESSQPLWVELRQILEGQITEHRNEVRFINHHGGFGWMELYASALVSPEGEIVGLSGSLNDITERKDREFLDQLERLTVQVLASSESLEAALPNILSVMGEIMEWDYSEFWIKNPGTQALECVQKWYTSINEHKSYYEEFPPFDGNYIQQCWQQYDLSFAQQTPLSEIDYFGTSSTSPQIQSAFSFPVSSGYDCLGMVVFIKEFHSQIDSNLFQRLKYIGGQIGAFMMRKSAEEKIQKHHDLMRAELDQAANYIRTLLPRTLKGEPSINHFFMPSNELGGDIYDYYWLDADHLAIYLVDAAGHGIQSALLSISVLNMLRSRSLLKADFYSPASVLDNLNQVFQMGEKGDDYFTIWYGVFNRTNGSVTYASAGHPPAVVLTSDHRIHTLNVGGIAIGLFPGLTYEQEIYALESGSSLHVFSDGVYEVVQPNGTLWSFDAFLELLSDYRRQNVKDLQTIFNRICDVRSSSCLEDDFSFIQIDRALA